jgi:hypothetical protein
MLRPVLEGNANRFGERFVLSLQRTLRVPDDGLEHPLRPGLGPFRLYRIENWVLDPPRNRRLTCLRSSW